MKNEKPLKVTIIWTVERQYKPATFDPEPKRVPVTLSGAIDRLEPHIYETGTARKLMEKNAPFTLESPWAYYHFTPKALV